MGWNKDWWWWLVGLLGWFLLAWTILAAATRACELEPITPDTPTGIAGCEVFGEGLASHYGPGNGVAMNFCTWEVRHGIGCGTVTITSLDTGVSITAPVVDFCDCWTGTANQRVVDLQYGVVAALALDMAQGIYPVVVERGGIPTADPAIETLPDTAMPHGG